MFSVCPAKPHCTIKKKKGKSREKRVRELRSKLTDGCAHKLYLANNSGNKVIS